MVGTELLNKVLITMKKTTLLILFFLIPIAYAFTGSNANYETTASIGLGAVAEQSSANYTVEGVMVSQPIGEFQSANYQIYLGPYYLLEILTAQDSVSISVPTSISYGTLWPGYSSTEKELIITNTGTLNITVQPMLDVSSDILFNNIYFGDQSSADTQIGDYTTATISAQASHTVYTQLDLTNYNASAGNKTGKIYYIAMEG